MTIAEKILKFPKGSAVWTSSQLESSVLAAAGSIKEKESAAKSGKAPLTLAAPTLSSLQLTEPHEEKYLSALINYMLSVLVSQVKLNGLQMKALDTRNRLSQQQLSMLEKGQAAMVKEAGKLADNHHSVVRLVLKVLSYVGAATMVIVGGCTGNAALIVGGLAMVVLTATNAAEHLANAMADWPVWARILTIAAVAVVAAVAISYGAAALAPVAAGETAAVGAETASETAAASTEAAAAAAGGVTASQIAVRALLISTMLNLWGEISKDIAVGAGASKDTQEKLALAVSIISAVAAMILAYRVECSSTATGAAARTQGLVARFKSGIEWLITKLPEQIGRNFLTIIEGLGITNQLAQSSLSIAEATFEIKRADAQEKFAAADADLSFYNDLLKQNTMMTKSDQAAMADSGKTFARMNDTWDDYVMPYRRGVENMA